MHLAIASGPWTAVLLACGLALSHACVHGAEYCALQAIALNLQLQRRYTAIKHYIAVSRNAASAASAPRFLYQFHVKSGALPGQH